jgi:hypothetical protein
VTARVDPRDVAVVVQGAVSATTAALLADLRRHLLGTRLILSTWEGTNVDAFDVDDVVLSRDPGAQRCDMFAGGRGPDINCNRMIRSTSAGLAVADRRHVVKLRTDCTIEHAGVLLCLGELPPAVGEWRLFERTIGVSSLYTRHPAKSPLGLFHPADTVQFGLLDDLRILWDVPFMSDEDAAWFSADRPGAALADTSPRFYNEQHVFLAALGARYRLHVESRVDRASRARRGVEPRARPELRGGGAVGVRHPHPTPRAPRQVARGTDVGDDLADVAPVAAVRDHGTPGTARHEHQRDPTRPRGVAPWMTSSTTPTGNEPPTTRTPGAARRRRPSSAPATRTSSARPAGRRSSS